jgi:hypothetical protein
MTTENTPQLSPVAKIRMLHDRLVKAEALVAGGKVHPAVNMPGHYIVEGSNGFYILNGACHCEDAVNRPELKYCKHRLSVEIFKEQQTLADNPKVSKATKTANAAPPESERTLEDHLADLYPKAKRSDSLR